MPRWAGGFSQNTATKQWADSRMALRSAEVNRKDCEALQTMSPGSPMIEFRRASYARNGRAIISGVTLEISQGESLVLLGRSGSGKTTLLRLINRMLLPTAGEVLVRGR